MKDKDMMLEAVDIIRQVLNKDKHTKYDSMPKKMTLKESNRPKNALDKRVIRHKRYKDNGLYEITKTTKAKGDLDDFKGILIYQNEEFILLKHKLGYKESFLKVDFETGEYEIKEVAK